ncbi:unnamed protein product [Vicia faba]|uniref:Uncharacterized protein n=1 Tax=Vicia faba TaxID=3906 RepID=A0AAV0ZXG1_VICFA|nr:unnamed protein product [Vicia faba]
MGSLSRSQVSFRRSGSSGLVWDDRFLSGELNKLSQQQQQHKSCVTDEYNNFKEHHAGTTTKRSRSTSAGRGYRTLKVSPTIYPPSPKLSMCGFFSLLTKKGRRSKSGNRRSR